MQTSIAMAQSASLPFSHPCNFHVVSETMQADGLFKVDINQYYISDKSFALATGISSFFSIINELITVIKKFLSTYYFSSCKWLEWRENTVDLH